MGFEKGKIVMGIFNLFRKTKAMNQTQPVSAENVNTDTVSETKPKTNVIRGSFSNIDAEYQVIGSIISELENLEFHLTGINTSGENSGHDWTVAYKKIYLSFDEFSKYAKTDYQEACSKQDASSPHLDWDSTSFLLTNRLSIRLYTLNDGTPEHNIYRAGWAVFIPEDMTDDDELFQKAQDVLRRYE